MPLHDLNVGPQTEPVPAYSLRMMVADDINFVMKSWKQSYRKQYKFLPDSVYHIGMEKLIAALGSTQRMLVAAADGPGGPATGDVLGFLAYRERHEGDPAIVCHYAYIKRRFRGQGVGTRLLTGAGWAPGTVILGSHSWHAPRQVRRKWQVYFNPFFCMAGYV